MLRGAGVSHRTTGLPVGIYTCSGKGDDGNRLIKGTLNIPLGKRWVAAYVRYVTGAASPTYK